MTFDKIEHQKLALEILGQLQVPGNAIELVYEFKKSVERATIDDGGGRKGPNQPMPSGS